MRDSQIQRIPIGTAIHRVRLPFAVRSAWLVEATGQPASTDRTVDEIPQDTTEPVATTAIEKQNLESLGASIERAFADTEQRRRQSIDELRLVAIEIAVAVASRVTGEHSETTTAGITRLVEEAVNRFGATETLTLVLNPLDLEQIQTAFDGKPPPWFETDGLRLVAGTAVARGDCEVNGATFNYVARMELVLEEIRVELLESLENAQIERRRTAAASSNLRRFPDRREIA